MRKRILSAFVCIAMVASLCTAFAIPSGAAEAVSPTYQTTARLMEDLNRGLIAVYHDANTYNGISKGVYLSWRLLGTESLESQKFDIYRDGTKIHTTGAHDATNYTDAAGTASNKYIVVKEGESIASETPVTPSTVNRTARGSLVNAGTSEKNSYTYMDVPIFRPDNVARMGDGKTSYYYTTSDNTNGGANDASVGDLDGDGDYEIVLKWEPNDLKDSAGADYTGRVYLDGYEISTDNTSYMWRIDLGQNVTAGQHYTQFMVYDFDGDGKAEIACKTAPGSVDGTGHYVTEVGDTDEIRNMTEADNKASYVGTSGGSKGKNLGPEYLTVFDGETGAALATTAFIPLGTSSEWGDSKYNRAERFLAGVAYLDGVHPSIIMCRGYYEKAVIRAYDWDGDELSLRWEHMGTKNTGGLSKGWVTMFHSGAHSLSIADVDNDGKDEIVYCSAVCDDDGTLYPNSNRGLGHGDALHVNDFDNDGEQEAFSVKEHKEGYANNAADYRDLKTGDTIWGKGASGDTGRGVMDNIDDAYAAEHPDALALGWSSSHSNVFDLKGNELNAKPATSSRTMTNFLIYWDGDLGRELLDDNQFAKYYADTGYTVRFYDDGNGYLPGTSNNDSKHVPSLSCDLWGDWREEVIMPTGKGQDETPYLRIFTSTLPTDYRLTTLMHDSQYRCAIAWQNTGYNQPPHTSYYIGSAALAKDSSGNTLNYLAPAVPYTKVTYSLGNVAVTGLTLSEDEVTVEKNHSIAVSAVLAPSDASKKGVTWESSDTSVATVANGIIKGIGVGKATITATSKDTTNGTFKDTCEVTVYEEPVTDVTISENVISVGIGNVAQLEAAVKPDNATDSAITWTSGNTAVATVAKDGTVTGVGYGTTYITATAADGIHSASCYVKVKPMTVEDATGDGVFVTTNTDAESVLSNSTATGASFAQTNAKVGGLFYKTFEAHESGQAKISFKFTTGGTKVDGTNWNWTGHEFSLYVKLLGENDANILTLCQPFAAKAGTMTSQAANAGAVSFASDWKAVVDNIGTVQGSAKRWRVDAEFDYDNNTVDAVLYGYGDGFGADPTAQYTKSFDLPDGVKFEKLAISSTLDNSSGDIVWVPVVQDVSYSLITTASGTSEELYERGYNTDWSGADLTDWVQTNTSTAALALDSDNGRIWYNPTGPGNSFSATKTISGISDDALVQYDVDWYFGDPTGRTSNYEYIQFGSNLRLGWNADYKVYPSVDAGTTYSETPVSSPGRGVYTKHISVVFDTAANKIKSLNFDGTDIEAYTDYELPTGATYDSVTLGFTRGSSVTYTIPEGIDKIRVAQFAYGEEEPDPTPTTAPATPTAAPATATPVAATATPVAATATPAAATTTPVVSGATATPAAATATPATATATPAVTEAPASPTATPAADATEAPAETSSPDATEAPKSTPIVIPADIKIRVGDNNRAYIENIDKLPNSEGTLLAAVYDNGQLKKLNVYSVSELKSYADLSGDFELNDNVVLMLWDSLTSMVPYAKETATIRHVAVAGE